MRYIIALLLLTSVARAENEPFAVVRIPSHGASATVIDTGPGYSYILGCGHAYEGDDLHRPMTFDIRRKEKGSDKQVGSWLVWLDYRADLSLVLLNDGPLDYVAPIAPRGHNPAGHQILACGYDGMRLPMFSGVVSLLGTDGHMWYTKEHPIPGRSGGGLLDMTSHRLIGVCHGYEVINRFPGRGLYVDHNTILAFLDSYRNRTKPQAAPCPPSG